MEGAGQLRTAGVGGIIGFDHGALLAMASARGVAAAAVAEFLPAIEPVALQKLRNPEGDDA